ncbi:MAG TPA: PLP-dependent aspartate aminotransferase family protein [Candidatus Saccharimonadales bacterium]|nr:PLP-dependent aspartate aminotransferase family protein [Candidatus Saccharimonadales bacterium]
MPKERTPKKAREEYRLRTRLIHGSFATGKWDYDHHVVPPQSSSATYRLSSVHRGAQGFVEFATPESRRAPIYIYDRLDEPSRGMLEENLAVAEGGEIAVAFATGMAAVSAALGILTSCGNQIVAHRVVYGCTHSLMTNWLPRYQIRTDFCDLTSAENLVKVATEHCRVVYFETPVNPTMELIDMQTIRKTVNQLNSGRSEAEKIRIVVDNTFATPFCQRPLEHGVDLVVHSLTKDIGGFGTETGGCVIGASSYFNHLMLYRKDFGGVLSPKNAWPILVYGLPTLATRLVNQQKSAMQVAEFLLQQPKIARVVYPGLPNFPQKELAHRQMTTRDGSFAPGSMLYFELKGKDGTPKGAAQAAERFVDYIAEKSYTITLAVSLGQIKTLIESPFSMTHAVVPEEEKMRVGLQPGGIRLSLGLEDWHDIIADLQDALGVV